MLSKIGRELANLYEGVIRNMGGRSGRLLRAHYWRRRLKHLGRNPIFGCNVHIAQPWNVSIGDDVWIDENVIILAGAPSEGERKLRYKPNERHHGEIGEVRIGSRVHIAPNVVLQGHGGLTIGADSGVASGAKIYSLSHHFRSEGDEGVIFKFSPMAAAREQSLICSPVYIGDACAIGLQAVVLPGSTLGDGSWLGTMSLLSGAIEGDTVAAGNPAVAVKKIR